MRPGADTDLAQQSSVVDQMMAQLQSKQDAYTDADLQAAVATVAQAEAAVALAQANLDQTTVVAPFDGVIATRLLTSGCLCHAPVADHDAHQRVGRSPRHGRRGAPGPGSARTRRQPDGASVSRT